MNQIGCDSIKKKSEMIQKVHVRQDKNHIRSTQNHNATTQNHKTSTQNLGFLLQKRGVKSVKPVKYGASAKFKVQSVED